MASPGLPVTIDTTYADSGSDPSVKIHQQNHDTIHAMLNRLDNAAPAIGYAYVGSSTSLMVLVPVVLASKWNPATSLYEPLKPLWATWGWTFWSTNAAAAAAPSAANACVATGQLNTGDVWEAHPDAS
jgi:hypothetical protein